MQTKWLLLSRGTVLTRLDAEFIKMSTADLLLKIETSKPTVKR